MGLTVLMKCVHCHGYAWIHGGVGWFGRVQVFHWFICLTLLGSLKDFFALSCAVDRLSRCSKDGSLVCTPHLHSTQIVGNCIVNLQHAYSNTAFSLSMITAMAQDSISQGKRVANGSTGRIAIALMLVFPFLLLLGVICNDCCFIVQRSTK